MKWRPKSAVNAMDDALDILDQQNGCSYAPLVQERTRRDFLAARYTDKVEQARDGDIDAGRQILEDYVRCVRRHSKKSWSGPNHYVYARYLADAFERILEGSTEPAIALGIKSSRPGRPRGTVTHEPIPLAAAYWLLRRHGYRAEKCIAALCEMTGADRRTVQDARKARYTKAFRRPDLVSDTQLRFKLRRWPFARPLLKLLRVGALNGRTLRE